MRWQEGREYVTFPMATHPGSCLSGHATIPSIPRELWSMFLLPILSFS